VNKERRLGTWLFRIFFMGNAIPMGKINHNESYDIMDEWISCHLHVPVLFFFESTPFQSFHPVGFIRVTVEKI